VADVVLVHGTTQSVTGWDLLVDEVTRRGHRALAVDLHDEDPDSSMIDLAARCRSQLPVDLSAPIVMAHSGSGILLPEVGDALGAAHEVYLAAAVPDPAGHRSFLDEMQADPLAMFNSEWFGVDPTSDPVLATYFLFHDCDLATLRWALGTLQLFDALRNGYAEVPPARDLRNRASTLVAPRDDRTLRPAYLAAIARERLGVEPVILSGGHCPHVSRPGEVAELLESLASS
jgi:pimeloyl-ACP methyl ester carboxylesterase